MSKITKAVLKFRRKQKPGAIMKPSTFQHIEQSAAAEGMHNPQAVAGAAYWQTVKAKARKARARARAKA